MSALHNIRMAARRLGIDVGRWPEGQVGLSRVKLLQHHGIDAVLDVGANDGGYAGELRAFGYRGKIVSFEPLRAPRQRLLAREPDPAWTVEPYALADFDGEIDIHVAGNRELSSSALPMLAAHSDAAPESVYTRVERCEVKRLDSVWSTVSGQNTFLKIDVQGFERSVLDGAEQCLTAIRGIQIELSFIPLYEGAWAWNDALERLTRQGFVIMRMDAGFRNDATGQVYQADAVLFREHGRS